MRISPATRCTALGHVAVNRRVWRPSAEDGSSPKISLSCGSNPISSMRSASSRVMNAQRFRLSEPCFIKSHRRPGVATTTVPVVAPRFFPACAAVSSSFCLCIGAPP